MHPLAFWCLYTRCVNGVVLPRMGLAPRPAKSTYIGPTVPGFCIVSRGENVDWLVWRLEYDVLDCFVDLGGGDPDLRYVFHFVYYSWSSTEERVLTAAERGGTNTHFALQKAARCYMMYTKDRWLCTSLALRSAAKMAKGIGTLGHLRRAAKVQISNRVCNLEGSVLTSSFFKTGCKFFMELPPPVDIFPWAA